MSRKVWEDLEMYDSVLPAHVCYNYEFSVDKILVPVFNGNSLNSSSSSFPVTEAIRRFKSLPTATTAWLHVPSRSQGFLHTRVGRCHGRQTITNPLSGFSTGADAEKSSIAP